MITETKLEDGRWRYDGDGSTETLGTSADGRYVHQIHHIGWAETSRRLSDAEIAKAFGGQTCSRAAT